jgi:hypothetical protein
MERRIDNAGSNGVVANPFPPQITNQMPRQVVKECRGLCSWDRLGKLALASRISSNTN